MESRTEETSSVKKEPTSYFKNEKFYLILLVAFTILIRFYYFFKLGEQPIWWDEGDYLAIAKVWALNMQTPEWWSHFTGMRPLLLPLIWAAFFKIGLGEMSLRFFTLLIPSILSVFLVYLLGKEFYNKKVGLIAGTMFSVYWVFLFYTFRLLTDIPAVCAGLASFYFFWSWYEKKEKISGLYLAVLFGVTSFSIRFPYALVLVTCAVFLLMTRKFSVFKDKKIWKGIAFALLLLSPYLIYLISINFAPLQFYFGEKAVSVHEPIAWYILPLFSSLVHSFWLVAFLIGILSLYPLILYGDKIFSQKIKEFNADLFLLLWLVIHFVFYVIIIRGATDRWILMIMPAAFLIASKGIFVVYEKLKKYGATLAIIVAAFLLIGGFYQNLSHSDSLILEKKDTYKEVKLAGVWLKENSLPEDKVITASIVQNQYYSERESFDFNYNGTDLYSIGCVDKFGSLSTNESCQRASEEAFNKKISEVRPTYYIASVFEPVFTPQWVYTYPERNNLTAVQAYSDGNGNPLLVIYKF